MRNIRLKQLDGIVSSLCIGIIILTCVRILSDNRISGEMPKEISLLTNLNLL